MSKIARVHNLARGRHGILFFFFFNDTATTEIYTLSLHDALPISHTADDQAETVLMRLLEGAGPRGLAGIAPVRGLFIRPFLGARRADIEAHLRARGLEWVEDASNSDPRFLRNRIRLDVLPYLAAAI